MIQLEKCIVESPPPKGIAGCEAKSHLITDVLSIGPKGLSAGLGGGLVGYYPLTREMSHFLCW